MWMSTRGSLLLFKFFMKISTFVIQKIKAVYYVDEYKRQFATL